MTEEEEAVLFSNSELLLPLLWLFNMKQAKRDCGTVCVYNWQYCAPVLKRTH